MLLDTGEHIPVLRSIRLAPPDEELVIRASITPKKEVKPFDTDDLDVLCRLFDSKARVTPNKKKPGRASKATAKDDEVDDSAKKPLKTTPKSIRFNDKVTVKKIASTSPIRRSPRRN